MNRPILWYGFFFAFGFFIGYLLFKKLALNFLTPYRLSRQEVRRVCEKISLYVIIGAILGARLGEVFFYQTPQDYLHDPLGIFRFWEGGLASHGAIFGLFLGILLFTIHEKKRNPLLSFVVVLDLLAIPALFAGGCIRVGNFFNQEILGIASDRPWAVLFGHPVDGLVGFARHPVQLYEAIFYFSFFIILWILRTFVDKMYRLGNTSGLCLVIVFLFRFGIEFLKFPLGGAQLFSLQTGQWLSIPCILMGLFLLVVDQGALRKKWVKKD